MASEINLNDASPAPASGYQNIKWQKGPQSGTDPAYSIPIYPVSAEVPNTGGVNLQTASYTAVAGDCGKLLVFNSASAVTLTLPAVPFGQWTVRVANIGAGTLSVSPGSLQLDGSTSSVSLAQFANLTVHTDGTNYFSQRGAVSSGTSIVLQTNGTNNAVQNKLNLVAGANTSLSSDSSGDVTIAFGNPTVTPHYVQSLTSGASSATASFTLSNPVTSGNTLLVWIECYSPSTTPTFTTPTVSDGVNGYSPIGSTGTLTRADGSFQKGFAFIAVNAAAGTTSVTGTVASNGYGFKIIVTEYGSSLGVDNYAVANSPSGGGALPSLTVGVTQASETLVLLSSFGETPTTAGYSQRQAGGGVNYDLELYDAAAAAAGSYTLNVSSSQNYGTAMLVALKKGPATLGTVTSVGLSTPGVLFSVSGSPVTTSGTLALSLLNQSANTFFRGPTSGAAAAPTFGALVAADLPAMVGDSGSGGTKGAAPAPASGDAAAGKFLKADGTWQVPPAASGMANPMTAVGDLIVGGTVSAGVATPTRVGAGTSGYVLMSNGPGVAPSWQASSSSYQPSALPLPPALSSWAWLNQGAATVSNNGSCLAITIPNNTSLNWRMLKLNTPATPYSFAAFFRSKQYFSSSQTTGLYFTDGTKLLGFELLTQGGPAKTLRVERITNVTTDSSTASSQSLLVASNGLGLPDALTGGMYARARNDGTNLYFDFSLDGYNWQNFYSEAIGAWLTPSAVGFGGISVVTAGTGPNCTISLLGWSQTASGSL